MEDTYLLPPFGRNVPCDFPGVTGSLSYKDPTAACLCPRPLLRQCSLVLLWEPLSFIPPAQLPPTLACHLSRTVVHLAEDLLGPTRLGEAILPALCLRASSAGATPSCLLCLIKVCPQLTDYNLHSGRGPPVSPQQATHSERP